MADTKITPLEITRDIIDVNCTTNPTLANVLFPANNIFSQSGTRLTLDGSGRVVIGSGVSKVLVSATIFCESITGSYVYLRISKNGTDFIQALGAKSVSGNFAGPTIGPVLTPVAPGDVIGVMVDSGNIRGPFSHFVVEVIQ